MNIPSTLYLRTLSMPATHTQRKQKIGKIQLRYKLCNFNYSKVQSLKWTVCNDENNVNLIAIVEVEQITNHKINKSMHACKNFETISFYEYK